MYRVMARKQPKRRRWCDRKKPGNPILLAEFEQHADVVNFMESVTGSWIVYPSSYIKEMNEQRKIA